MVTATNELRIHDLDLYGLRVDDDPGGIRPLAFLREDARCRFLGIERLRIVD